MGRELAVENALSIAGGFGRGPVMPFYQGHLPAAACQGQGGSAAGQSSAYDQRAALAGRRLGSGQPGGAPGSSAGAGQGAAEDRKSTRLNSSHVKISYAVFCLKNKKE